MFADLHQRANGANQKYCSVKGTRTLWQRGYKQRVSIHDVIIPDRLCDVEDPRPGGLFWLPGWQLKTERVMTDSVTFFPNILAASDCFEGLCANRASSLGEPRNRTQ
jgi:hypothetical protein